MSKFIIQGGTRLQGSLDIYSSKNACLPLIAAALLADGVVTILRPPKIQDLKTMVEIMKDLGCQVKFNSESLEIDPRNASSHEISKTLAKELRSSIFLMGSLLGKFKKAVLSYPGGCDIGLRPIDLHLDGLKKLNVKIKEEGGNIFLSGEEMKGGHVVLDFPSVGATENLMMAAVLAKGRTIIENPAKEPEIVDLMNFLNQMGGKITFGQNGIIIDGVKKLGGITYSPIPDRIVAGTYLIGAAMTGGEIQLNNCNFQHLHSLISKLNETSCKLWWKNDTIHLKAPKRVESIKQITTSPYPGFPTDLQSQIMSLCTVASGTTIIEERMFETRFKHALELKKLGADITIVGKTAIVKGVTRLVGGEVFAEDLRGGASLVLAGIKAEGETTVLGVKHIDRGYEGMEIELSKLGAKISRE